MSTVNCEIKIPEVQGLENQKLTVGRIFTMECQAPEDLKPDELESVRMEALPLPTLAYKVLNKAKDAQLLKFDMTLYVAGSADTKQWKMYQGDKEWLVNATPVTFESVLKPQENGQPQKPYGPIFPVPLSIPNVYFLFLIGVLLVAIVLSIVKWRRLRFYKSLKDGLKQFQSPVQPEVQFYRKLRSLEKVGYPLVELEDAFRLYILRTFSIPAYQLEDQRLIRYFKRNYPEMKESRIQVQKLLAEFSEFKKSKSEISSDEIQQFLKRLYRFVDRSSAGQRGVG